MMPGALGRLEEGLKRRSRQLPNAVRRAVTHPRWLVENLRLLRERRGVGPEEFQLDAYAQYVTSDVAAVARVSGASEEDVAAELGHIRQPDRALALTPWGPTGVTQRILWALVRLLKPSVIVETGVAEGFSSFVILSALHENGHGHLYSLDLPVLAYDERTFVGRLVPEDLRTRWTLKLGPSRQILPALVETVGPIDLAYHDADLMYTSKLEEHRTVWPRLRADGVMVSNAVANAAFVDFAHSVGVEPLLVPRPADPPAVGVLKKPSFA